MLEYLLIKVGNGNRESVNGTAYNVSELFNVTDKNAHLQSAYTLSTSIG